MDGSDFIKTAELLCQNVSHEAHQRSATSRAYYACFLVTRSTVFKNVPKKSLFACASVSQEPDITHSLLRRWLKNCKNELVRGLGHDLGDLFVERGKADYDMDRAHTHEKAREAVDNAREYLRQLEATEPSLIGSQVDESLRQEHPGRT